MHDRTPILVGVGQYCPLAPSLTFIQSPIDLAAAATANALADCRSVSPIQHRIDTIAFVRLFSDSAQRLRSPFGGSTKPPVSVARRLGLTPSRAIYSTVGGNCPQELINELCEAIARGECGAAVICGAEALRVTFQAQRNGLQPDWEEDPSGVCEDRGYGPPLIDAQEINHGIGMPINTYPLFEHAIRGARHASVATHLRSMAQLFARFNSVAQRNPNARFATARVAQDLATVTRENRWMGHPYPKWLNAQDRVDQAAAVVLTSVSAARELGIEQNRWIFLHGCADVAEKPLMLDRVDYNHSPAMLLAVERALMMAGLSAELLSVFDLYSCFPSAVELACQAIGIAEDDPRDLTVTGGLPFFGGPGNNYSLHAIAEICARLRASPREFGMVMANGGYLSKQSCGIYSAVAIPGEWAREPPGQYQHRIDNLRGPVVETNPRGRARVETYTVAHERGEPALGIIIGRLLGNDARFIANAPPGRSDILRWMIDADPLQCSGEVQRIDGRNVFLPDHFAQGS